jgi:hypothetical protein
MSTAAPSPRSESAAWWPATGLVALVAAASLVTRADADLWGHVRFGLDILETWRLPAADPYSFTQDTPWVNHEWLSELLMGAAWAGGGAAGLVLLKGALVSATLLVIWTAWRRVRVTAQIAALFALIAGSLHITNPLRPQLWTFLCLAVLVRVLVADDRRARRLLPLLFVVWANAHGGWVVGCGVLAVWAAGESWADRSAGRQWLWLLPACVAATLVTPYGATLWTFVASTVRPGRQIEEWAPLWASNPWNWLGWSLALAIAAWSLVRSERQRLARGLVLAMLAYGGLTVLRIGPLFLEAALILGADAAARRWPARGGGAPAGASVARIAAGLLLVVAPGALAVRLAQFATGCLPPLPHAALEVRAVEALAATTGPARLVTFFDWGQYAIWHLGPRIRVSMDGRRETVYSDARLAEHDAIVQGTPEGLAALASWNAEYVWLPASSGATRDWLVDHGYRIDLQSDDSFLAVRADLPRLPVTPLVGPAGRCFPR